MSEVVESAEAEGRALFDRAARRALGISGEEFLARWDSGEWADCDDPNVDGIAMLLPFAR